jgi:hypothetical protein
MLHGLLGLKANRTATIGRLESGNVSRGCAHRTRAKNRMILKAHLADEHQNQLLKCYPGQRSMALYGDHPFPQYCVPLGGRAQQMPTAIVRTYTTHERTEYTRLCWLTIARAKGGFNPAFNISAV